MRARARTLVAVRREDGFGAAARLVARKTLSLPYRAVIPGSIPYESALAETGFGKPTGCELAHEDDRGLWQGACGDTTRIAGVVVLFNPDESVLQNIRTYANQVDTLFVVDNSDSPRRALVESLTSVPNLRYSHLGCNRGIAAALNVGALEASAQGYEFLLTMDQDSKASDDLVAQLAAAREQYRGFRVGLIAARHEDPAAPRPGTPENLHSNHVQPVLTVITSGNLLSLRAWREVGPFADDLFIDQVDNEFCLRLHRQGYEVLLVNNLFFQHTIGNVKRYRLLGKYFYTSNHSPTRKYYIVRNRLKVSREYKKDYPAFRRFELGQIAVEATKIALFEEQRGEKLRMMLRGFLDYRAGVSGQYRQ
ncbi:MAG: glycosyltransferase family 2 protein [Thermoleophilia bacterium]